MIGAKHCQEQSSECIRLMGMAQSAAEAEVLKYIAQSWSRLAGQIDRYDALMREQRRVVEARPFPESQAGKANHGSRRLRANRQVGV